MKASEVKGRAVVSLQEAQKIGTVSSLLFDPNTSAVVGLKISTGLFSGDRYVRVGDIRSIGPDAVTVPGQSVLREKQEELPELNAMPDLSDVAGTKVVSEGGSLIGSIDDVVVDMQTYRITGYELDGSLWDQLTGHQKVFSVPQAGVRFGRGLLVVSDEIAAQLGGPAVTTPTTEEAPSVVDTPVATPTTSYVEPATSYAEPAAYSTTSTTDATPASTYSDAASTYSEPSSTYSETSTTYSAPITPFTEPDPYVAPAADSSTYQPSWDKLDDSSSTTETSTTDSTLQPTSATSSLYPASAEDAMTPSDSTSAYSTRTTTADEEEEKPAGQGGQSTSSY